MGLDVNLYAVASPTPEELAAAEAYFAERDCGFADHSVFNDSESPFLVIDAAEWHEFPRVEVYTLTRYYGPGYERGPWPIIFGAIVTLQAAFPNASVYYGSDSDDDGLLVTEEFLDEMWQHYLGPNGQDYRKPRPSPIRDGGAAQKGT